MKLFSQIVSILLPIAFLFGLIGYAICHSPTLLQPEYSTHLSVETPDKIENAISNVVADLEKRDFVPVNLDVKWHPTSKTYVIYMSGIDRTKLSRYEP